MFAFVKLVLVMALSLGGVGATAYAAQDSLPTDPLYAVKLITEDVRFALTSDEQAQIDFQMELAAVRVQEMTRLTEQGRSIPGDVPLRLQMHLELAVQTTARFEEPQMQTALQQIRAAIQTQAQIMTQLRVAASDNAGQQLRLAERALARAREMCDLGLSEPQLFRERIRASRPKDAPGQPETTPGPGPQATPCGDCTPQGTPYRYQDQEQHRSGSEPTPQPSDGQRHGPGPQSTACGDCTPQGDQNQNQEQEQHQYGPQPTEQPGDSNGTGPGPQSTEQSGDPNGSGSQPTQEPGRRP